MIKKTHVAIQKTHFHYNSFLAGPLDLHFKNDFVELGEGAPITF
jgi:hypothetical protein